MTRKVLKYKQIKPGHAVAIIEDTKVNEIFVRHRNWGITFDYGSKNLEVANAIFNEITTKEENSCVRSKRLK